jgi:hypothetical protein
MRQNRGFFLMDLTLGIVLAVAVASLLAHFMWLYKRDCLRLAAVRDAARNEQATLYRATRGQRAGVGGQWLIKPVNVGISATRTLPVGSHWIAIQSANDSAAPTLYALALSPRAARAGVAK